MGLFSKIGDWLSGSAQTTDEASAHLAEQRATLIQQLNEKLLAGKITKDYYTSQVYLIETQFNAEDPTGAAWDAFSAQFVLNVANLPGALKDAVGNTAEWLGGTVGSALGGIENGLLNGIFSRLGWKFWLVILALSALLWWGFKHGPLKGAKIKAIPIPI